MQTQECIKTTELADLPRLYRSFSWVVPDTGGLRLILIQCTSLYLIHNGHFAQDGLAVLV